MISKPFLRILAFLCVLCSLTDFSWAQSVQYFIAPDGQDGNAGTLEKPFATLERARDVVRQAKQRQGHLIDTVIIWLRKGVYQLDSSFTVDSRDAGLPGAPVVYRAYPGEKVILRGGIEIPSSAFQPVKDRSVLRRMVKSARSHIRQADLQSLGVENYGEVFSRGMGIPVKPYPMELFFNEQLMQVARWPNEGYVEYGRVTEVGSIPRYRNMTIAPGGIPVDPDNPPPQYAPHINDTSNRPGSLIYLNTRPARWTKAEEVWLFGYWNKRWASQTLKIKSIDTRKKEITFAQPHHYGLKDKGIFYAFNLLEEIDKPGEYHIDRHTGKLYFWPPSDIRQGLAVVSLIDTPLILLKNASDLIFRDLILEVTRGDGLVMEGGANNLIAGCTVRNIGLDGIKMTDNSVSVNFDSQTDEEKAREIRTYYPSRHNGVVGCELYKIRENGILLRGGDRKTLAPGKNYAINNHLHDEANIRLSGCGNRVAHNLIHDNSYGGIQYNGNNHLIEYNELTNCLKDADDWGAIYTGRNPSCQGNIVRFNYIHHNTGPVEKGTGSNGIYLDDGTTGQIIYGNVIYKTGHPARAKMGGVFVHGGKDNLIVNNIFIDCKLAVGFSPWSQERWEKFLVTRDMKTRLYEEVNSKSPLYLGRYPVLNHLQENAGVNKIKNNLIFNCREFLAQKPGSKTKQIQENNWITNENPGFVNVGSENFQLRKDAEVFKKISSFQAVPFEKIGLYQDKYRPKLPLRANDVVDR